MLKQNSKLEMTFASFFEVYEADKKQRVKESTWESKSHVIRTKILPYFGNRKIAEIEAKDVIAWQEQAARLERGEITKEEYDQWRYKYPELDTSNHWKKTVPSQGLSDLITQALKDETN